MTTREWADLRLNLAAGSAKGFARLPAGPSLAAQVLGSPDLLWGGLLIFLVTGTGAAVTVAFRRGVSGPAAMLAGCLALLAGAAMTLPRSKRHRLPPSSPAPR
jgi:hypothetical protein